MSGETLITIIGNITDAPGLRFVPSGEAVVNFTVASTARRFDKQSNTWVDADTMFLRVSVWGKQAENIAESLEKGDRVVVYGYLVQRSYEKDGTKHTVYEVRAEEVGASLRFRTMKHHNPSVAGSAQPAEDPWATPAYPDEPPF